MYLVFVSSYVFFFFLFRPVYVYPMARAGQRDVTAAAASIWYGRTLHRPGAGDARDLQRLLVGASRIPHTILSSVTSWERQLYTY